MKRDYYHHYTVIKPNVTFVTFTLNKDNLISLQNKKQNPLSIVVTLI